MLEYVGPKEISSLQDLFQREPYPVSRNFNAISFDNLTLHKAFKSKI
jgi:hypothetical protein